MKIKTFYLKFYNKDNLHILLLMSDLNCSLLVTNESDSSLQTPLLTASSQNHNWKFTHSYRWPPLHYCLRLLDWLLFVAYSSFLPVPYHFFIRSLEFILYDDVAVLPYDHHDSGCSNSTIIVVAVTVIVHRQRTKTIVILWISPSTASLNLNSLWVSQSSSSSDS